MAALAAGLFITCVTFTSCTSDIGDNPVYNDEPNGGMIVGEIVVTNGMFLLRFLSLMQKEIRKTLYLSRFCELTGRCLADSNRRGRFCRP